MSREFRPFAVQCTSGERSVAEEYYIRLRGQIQGPFTQERLQSLAGRQRFTRVHQVSTDKVTWSPASKFPELFPPPPAPKQRQATSAPAGTGAADSGGYQLALDTTANGAATPGDSVRAEALVFEAAPSRTEKEWFYVRHGQEKEMGPVSISEFQELAEFGELQPEDLIWKSGMTEWVQAGFHSEIFGQVATESAYAQEQFSGPTEPVCPLAYVSLGLGIGGLTILVFAGSIAAVICGHLALRQIRRNGLGGRGLALTGLILGYIGVAITILTLFIVMCVLIFQKAELAMVSIPLHNTCTLLMCFS